MFTLDALYPPDRFRSDGMSVREEIDESRDIRTRQQVIWHYFRALVAGGAITSAVACLFMLAFGNGSENRSEYELLAGLVFPLGAMGGGMFESICSCEAIPRRTFVQQRSIHALNHFNTTSHLSLTTDHRASTIPHHDAAYEHALQNLDRLFQEETTLLAWQEPTTYSAFRYPVKIELTDGAGGLRSVTRDFAVLFNEIYTKLNSRDPYGNPIVFTIETYTFSAGDLGDLRISDIVSIKLDRGMAQRIIDMVNIRVVPTVASHETVISVADVPVAWPLVAAAGYDETKAEADPLLSWPAGSN